MPFVTKLREGYDLVMGNRFEGGIEEGAMPWKNRYIGNPILTTIGRLFFGAKVRDFHCGLRGFSKEAFDRMGLCTTGMEYASEMVIKSILKDMKIEEVPTTLRCDGRSRPPHLDPWRDGWRHLRFMLLYSPRWLFLYPGIILVVLGTMVGIWVVPGAKVVGGIRFDIHTLLYGCVAILIGFQAVSFFLLSRVFAAREGLLPYTEGLQRFTAWFRMEWSIAAGSILAVLGLGGLASILFYWGLAGFGGLEVSETMRIAIPSATATAIGCNVVLTSLFLDILNLPTKPGSADQAT